jgi:hypothetical protein
MENVFYTFGVIPFGFYIFEHVYLLYTAYEIRQHDKYCEDCADDLMAETFKRMRDDK